MPQNLYNRRTCPGKSSNGLVICMCVCLLWVQPSNLGYFHCHARRHYPPCTFAMFSYLGPLMHYICNLHAYTYKIRWYNLAKSYFYFQHFLLRFIVASTQNYYKWLADKTDAMSTKVPHCQRKHFHWYGCSSLNKDGCGCFVNICLHRGAYGAACSDCWQRSCEECAKITMT